MHQVYIACLKHLFESILYWKKLSPKHNIYNKRAIPLKIRVINDADRGHFDEFRSTCK